MKQTEKALASVGEGIDNLVTIEITGRGVVGPLYAAARAGQGDRPLCMQAAQALHQRLQKGDVVVIATGLPTFPWFSPEQDGPVGAALLARALLMAYGVTPVILTEPHHVEVCRAVVRGAGLYPRGIEDALRLPTTTAVVDFPLEVEAAQAVAGDLLRRLQPKAAIAIERPGANEHGHYHSAGGRRLTDHCAKVDVLFERARAAGALTIGIGDGGNELGCGLIREAVFETVPVSSRCKCPCGGSVVPATRTDMLIIAAISNWGAYGIAACLALLLARPEVMFSREVERRAHDLCAAAEANNDGPGLLDVGTDAVPPDLHGHIVDLLGFMVKSGMDFGRLYKVPRHEWL